MRIPDVDGIDDVISILVVLLLFVSLIAPERYFRVSFDRLW